MSIRDMGDAFRARALARAKKLAARLDGPVSVPTAELTRFVYFIGAADERIVKIGIADVVDVRLRALQSASPLQLRVLASARGDSQTEAWLHTKFANLRLHGEWFRLGEEIEGFLKDLPADLRPLTPVTRPEPIRRSPDPRSLRAVSKARLALLELREINASRRTGAPSADPPTTAREAIDAIAAQISRLEQGIDVWSRFDLLEAYFEIGQLLYRTAPKKAVGE